MRVQNKRILLTTLFIAISFVCIAQIPPTPPGPPIPPGVPIDGGVSLGVFFAIIFGAKKLLRFKK